MAHSPLLLQLVVILGTARLLGLLLRYLGQASVIGEMTAGLVLGPVVFGSIAPELHASIFERSSLGALNGLSELGLVLFMFIVGAELRLPTGARKQLIGSGWIGVLSVFVPMGLGLGAATFLYPQLAPKGVAFMPFALFLAAAMSITAFPVMARILKERLLTQTTLGRYALTAAAVADVLAWLMLALVVVLASSGQNWSRFWITMGGLSVLAVLIFGAIRPLVARVLASFAQDGRPEGGSLALLLIGAFGCAYVTEILDIHAVFGAFLFGACLPRDDRLLAALIERIEYVAIIVLMPIFFALAGLKTTPDAFVGTGFGTLMVILGIAIAGKMLGGVMGARIAGQPWRFSFAIGSLMNARGMMELIVIKVGLDIGVIGNELFTMLMVMAIVTTFMTGPLLTLFGGKGARPSPEGRGQRAKRAGEGL